MDDNNLTVYVCDAIMGSGKTSAAINMMNADSSKRYVFVTQFLSEVDRICKACGFVQPSEKAKSKIASIHGLLVDKKNIASTHSLFYRYTTDTLAAIRAGHYTLVLDEVIDVVRLLEISPSDIVMMIDANVVAIDPDTHRVEWVRDDYDGVLNSCRTEIESGYVTYEDGHLMVWTMPIELFTAFDNVYILTYMFDSQFQYLYFKMHGVQIKYIDVQSVGGKYLFSDSILVRPNKHRIHRLTNKISIVEDDALNAIGNQYFALSSTWYKKITDAQAKELQNNIFNLMRNKLHVGVNDTLWAVYKSGYSKVKKKGYMGAFLTYNARAMNDYGDRHCLAYCVNVFPSPNEYSYFSKRGYEIDADALALSCMVQWIWRSAIRNGDNILVYIPSSRMRGLLKQWLCEVSNE